MAKSSEANGEPFETYTDLSGPYAHQVARSFLAQAGGPLESYPHRVFNISARQATITGEPSRSRVQVFYNVRGPKSGINYFKHVDTRHWRFAEVMTKSFSAQSSAEPQRWRKEYAARGQGDVAALLAQTFLEGEIVTTTATLPNGQTVPHYANRLEGRVVDFTRVGFPAGTTFGPYTQDPAVTRESLLGNPETRRRYEVLKGKFRNNATGLADIASPDGMNRYLRNLSVNCGRGFSNNLHVMSRFAIGQMLR